MTTEMIALALKGLLVQRVLGRKFAIAWMKSRGFTCEQVIAILLKGVKPC